MIHVVYLNNHYVHYSANLTFTLSQIVIVYRHIASHHLILHHYN